MRSIQNTVGSHSRKHFAGGENVMLELILEGGTEFYEAFQAGETPYAKA